MASSHTCQLSLKLVLTHTTCIQRAPNYTVAIYSLFPDQKCI
jgi:hypothetical protein